MDKFNKLINSGNLILVDFFADWCGPCKMMVPVLEQLKNNMGDKITIIKIDIDKPANSSLVQKHNIQTIPTLVLFKNGKILWKQSGGLPITELQKIIDKYS